MAGLMAPAPIREIVVTVYDDGQITTDAMSFRPPRHTSQEVGELLMEVGRAWVRHAQSGDRLPALPLFPSPLEESLV